MLLTTPTDRGKLHRHLTEAFPDKDFIKKTYQRVGDFLGVAVGEGYQKVYEFNFNLFCRVFKLPVIATHNALKILTQAGYIEFVEEIETQSRVLIIAQKEDLYHIESENPYVDRVLQALLRTYSGLFSDYVFINESVLEFRFGIMQQDIYEALIELTHMHILHYVPRKRTPYIIYTTSREEPKYLLLPKAVYEEQRQKLSERIEAVINYAFNDNVCRERQLLTYFGERVDNDCGHCDVCIARRKHSDHSPQDVQDGILYMSQVKPRRLEEFVNTLSFPQEEVLATLSSLVDEGLVIHKSDDTYVNPKPLK